VGSHGPALRGMEAPHSVRPSGARALLAHESASLPRTRVLPCRPRIAGQPGAMGRVLLPE
jgi:hypothetical protein